MKYFLWLTTSIHKKKKFINYSFCKIRAIINPTHILVYSNNHLFVCPSMTRSTFPTSVWRRTCLDLPAASRPGSGPEQRQSTGTGSSCQAQLSWCPRSPHHPGWSSWSGRRRSAPPAALRRAWPMHYAKKEELIFSLPRQGSDGKMYFLVLVTKCAY